MSVISKALSLGRAALAVGLLGSALPGCAAFATQHQSTVAQGKYYSTGEPHYDEFFIGLYLMQVEMGEAPRAPEAERQSLAQMLALPAQADAAAIGDDLREEALKLSRAGVHLRLDQSLPSEKPEAQSAVIRANSRPKDALALLTHVEASASHLLRSIAEMKEGEAALAKLEGMTGPLDSGVETAFAEGTLSKQTEVKKNLTDAHQLLALMRKRAAAVQSTSEQLLGALSKAMNTDDGSLGSRPGEEVAGAEAGTEAGKQDASKKPAAKPNHPKSGKPVAPAPAASATPAAAAHPKPAPAANNPAPAKPPAASKPAPAARDFEP